MFIVKFEMDRLNQYYQHKCQRLMETYSEENIEYQRGLYSGYLFGLKLTQYYLDTYNESSRIDKMTFYKALRNHKNRAHQHYYINKEYSKGTMFALSELIDCVFNQNLT